VLGTFLGLYIKGSNFFEGLVDVRIGGCADWWICGLVDMRIGGYADYLICGCVNFLMCGFLICKLFDV